MKIAPLIEALSGFENDLLEIINGLTFHKGKNFFQKLLVNVFNDINKSKNIYVKSDKTDNFYKLSPKNYDTLVKGTKFTLINKINCDSKYIIDKLDISERVGKLQAKEACILLKDHKSDARAKSSTRLNNSTIPEVEELVKPS